MRSLGVADELMKAVIDNNILQSPWFIATDVWMAIRLGNRAALSAAGPLVAVRSEMRRSEEMPVWEEQSHPHADMPQTTLELRDATHKKVLGRAKIGFTTWPIDDVSGPTLFAFRIFAIAAEDGTLVEAAILADSKKPETSAALAAAGALGTASANFLAARVLLWCGVEAFCNSHVGEQMPYPWPLRAAPRLVDKNGPFFAWRGMKLWSLPRHACARTGILDGGWHSMALGCTGEEGELFGGMACAEDLESDGEDEDLHSSRNELISKLMNAEEASEGARAKEAERLLVQMQFDPDNEDSDSECEYHGHDR